MDPDDQGLGLVAGGQVEIQQLRLVIRSRIFNIPLRGRLAGPIAAAGSNRVLLGPVAAADGRPGRYWLRAVMDNLTRGGAVNALEIAAAVLS